MKLERYEKYKDSGIEWIGEIPEHWDVVKVKQFFYEKKKSHDINLKSGAISFGEVVYKDDEKIPFETKASYQVVNKGDFLINPLNLNYDLKSLRIALSNIDVVVSSGYIVLKAKQNIIKKYYKWFLHRFDVAFMKTLGAGVRQTLSFTDIGKSLIVYPPIEEQIQIADFLDKKTAQIDKAITLKEQLIERLKERRQILINDAVTKGLDKTVKMKDSGIEWIGEIPEHWEIRRLGTLGSFSKGGGVSRENLTKSGFQVILYGDIYTKYETFVMDTEHFIDESVAKKSIQIQKFDILLTGSGETKEDIGKCITFLGSKETYAGGDIIIFRPKSEPESLFLTYALNSFNSQKQKIAMSKGEIIVHIYGSKLKNLYVAYPPLEEQSKISKYIIEQTKKIDKAIELQQKQIEKLKEYRASLIDSVVTGKARI